MTLQENNTERSTSENSDKRKKYKWKKKNK